LADLGLIDTKVSDELLLHGKGDFREEREHRRHEVARALRIGDHRGKLMRGKVRPIRGVDRRQHLSCHIRHHRSLNGHSPGGVPPMYSSDLAKTRTEAAASYACRGASNPGSALNRATA